MVTEHLSDDSTARGPGLKGGGDLGMWRAWPPVSGNLEQEARATSTERRELEESPEREGSGFNRGAAPGWFRKALRGRVQKGRVCAMLPF